MESTIAGRYAVVEALGAAATGTRVLARDAERDALVVVTELPEDADAAAVRRAAELRHDALATVVEIVDERRVVEEMPAGEPLDRVLRDRRALSPADALHVARHVATALAHAHAAGVVHGALTPASVVVRRDVPPRAWLVGLAAGRGATPAPAYTAPEQARGNAADARTDVFALGLLLFEMIQGKPFLPADAAAREKLFASTEPVLPRFSTILPAGVSALVARAIRLAPAQRFETMEMLRDAIEACLRRIGELRVTAAERRRVAVAAAEPANAGAEAQIGAPEPARVRRTVAPSSGASLPGRVMIATAVRPPAHARWIPIGGFVALAVLALGWPLVRSRGATTPAAVPVGVHRPDLPRAHDYARADVIPAETPRPVAEAAPVDVARLEPPAAPAPAAPAVAPEPAHAVPVACAPLRIVSQTPRTDGPIRALEGDTLRFAVAARDAKDERVTTTWLVDGRRVRTGSAFRWTVPPGATATAHAVEARVSDGSQTARTSWTVDVRPRMSDTNVREWLARLTAAWDRKDVATLRLFGIVRTDAEAETITRRFSRWGGYRIALVNPTIHTEGAYATVSFDEMELDGRNRLLSSHRAQYTLEKQPTGFVALRPW